MRRYATHISEDLYWVECPQCCHGVIFAMGPDEGCVVCPGCFIHGKTFTDPQCYVYIVFDLVGFFTGARPRQAVFDFWVDLEDRNWRNA